MTELTNKVVVCWLIILEIAMSPFSVHLGGFYQEPLYHLMLHIEFLRLLIGKITI